ncbi:MAG: hypothetical protein OEM39_07400 [Acidimicrobiia bacterium]|nr:hypothetical protein [Acidimicrobiia bacterium]MDH3462655.1 hypothetical protein [Acidimicrobiia bacterium]
MAGVGAAAFGVRAVFVVAGAMSVLGGVAARMMFREKSPVDPELGEPIAGLV